MKSSETRSGKKVSYQLLPLARSSEGNIDGGDVAEVTADADLILSAVNDCS